MKHETFTENATTKPGGPGAPVTINHHIYLTRHGVVQGWTTAHHGKPVAVVDQRSTYNHDIDSVVGFLRWGDPKLTHSVKTLEKGAAEIGYTFNWFYVDDKHDAYYVSGRDPTPRQARRPQPADLGHRRRRMARLPAARQARPRDRPEARLLRQLEQQAGAGLLGGRRPVRVRPDVPVADAGRPAEAPARRSITTS